MIGSRSLLGDQSTSVLRDAAQSVIETLKDDTMKDPERHEDISQLLTRKPASTPGGISSEQYAKLVQFGKQLDDYDDAKKQQQQSKNEDGDDGDKVDDEMGVAVLFDESEDEDGKAADGDSDIEEDVVVDASSSSEGEDKEEEDMPEAYEDDEVDVVVQGATDDDKKKARSQERFLSVHEIDAHFLQGQLSRHYDDADVAADIAKQVLEVLDIRNQSDKRECENKLLILLGFDLFDTIKLLLHNRVRVWACVSMKRAQTEEERSLVEKALDEEVSGEGKQVWEEMHSKGRAEDWTRERMRGITDTLKKEDMDSKDVSKALDSIGVKVAKAERDLDVSQDGMDLDNDDPIELDLEALAFKDGAHTMTSKKCTLPDKSWRAMKKGYEEVHVPAVRSIIPKDEKLVSIKDLPPWCQQAFPGRCPVCTSNYVPL
jgi:pre-mRNA-splicing helicase BRR2